ncbi:hypothetical protein [Flammeovirga pacifica]|uniref:DUF4412 domain-containing protein n=1 Tax=Flammeovirga pacifica TaxID=915059 RepID=A0A1S1YSI5_FLAPC|nr:hypothetical protein [Flammeovirga pacifica]OHX63992.1 hypothetical protein NH26_20490 [Flammeovirga pacifica]
MKIFLLFISFSCIVFYSSAQQKGVTESGDEVVLYDDGTWKYLNESSLEETDEIKINPTPYTKDSKSTFLVKSNKVNLGFYINPKKWSFKKAIQNPQAEYEFQLKGNDIYGMVITEGLEIPLESMVNIALENGKKMSPDLKIINKEFRTVNGLKVLCMEMHGTMKGIKFGYYGYYYSSKEGTTQFITYSSKNIIVTQKKSCESLLNGIVNIGDSK